MPNKSQTKTVVYRLWTVFLLCVIGFAILCFRVFDLQVVRAAQYRRLADANRYAIRYVPKERGVFLDRYGEQLVSNVPKYFTATIRGTRLGENFLTVDEALAQLATNSATIGYQLDRRYTYPESLVHVLGYVGAPTADELLADRSLSPTDVVGKIGLERTFDEELQGKATEVLYEVDALGKSRRRLQEIPGQSGAVIPTTLDPYLSEVAYQALGDQRGVVVVTDVMTGEILSLVSRPAYSGTTMSEHAVDPQQELIRKASVQSYFSHPQKLFFNRAVSGLYPPGSVFKLVTALAGLENESITGDTSVRDDGTLKVGEYEYANWYFTQYGRTEGAISLARALARSNDIYFYKVAEWVGPTALAEFARMFGFGSNTGIEISGEAAGTVPDPIWKEQTIGEQWFLGNTYHFGIGQGDILVTPLQIAQLIQIMGNAGKICPPHLIDKDVQCSESGVSQAHLDLVLQGMIAACSPGGTAFPFFSYNQSKLQPDLSGYDQLAQGAVACKTGTAEFGAADTRGYRPTHGWFTATVDVSDLPLTATQSAASTVTLNGQPRSWAELHSDWAQHVEQFPKRIGITVLVESDEAQPYKEGSRDAAPIAKVLLDWMMGLAVGPPTSRDSTTEGE